MSRIFITGSSSGLGLMAAQLLAGEGHRVVVHARDRARAAAVRDAVAAEAVVVGDLSVLSQMADVAGQVNDLGQFDAVIHNVGIGYREPSRVETEDGLPSLFATNVLAPYVLTALIALPERLIYLSSALHRFITPDFKDLLWTDRSWDGMQAYGESKLHDVLLAFAFARRWPHVKVNALEPGWVPTHMGGPEAPDDLQQAHVTQAWLAVSSDPAALATGEYYFHKEKLPPHPTTRCEISQDDLLARCAQLSKVALQN